MICDTAYNTSFWKGRAEMLNREYAFVSFVVSQLLMVTTLIAVPKIVGREN